jgi:hypothetical protein
MSSKLFKETIAPFFAVKSGFRDSSPIPMDQFSSIPVDPFYMSFRSFLFSQLENTFFEQRVFNGDKSKRFEFLSSIELL